MELGQYQIQIFVSLVVILGAAFVALICDFLKGNNEQLRELTIELKVRREEEQRRSQMMTGHTISASAPALKERMRMERVEKERTEQRIEGPETRDRSREPSAGDAVLYMKTRPSRKRSVSVRRQPMPWPPWNAAPARASPADVRLPRRAKRSQSLLRFNPTKYSMKSSSRSHPLSSRQHRLWL